MISQAAKIISQHNNIPDIKKICFIVTLNPDNAILQTRITKKWNQSSTFL
jgi:hypothetical protein